MTGRVSKAAAVALDDFSTECFAIYDRIRKLKCPTCGSYGTFQVTADERNQRMACYAWIPRTDDDGSGYCGYEAVYRATVIAELPEPRFTAIEPPERVTRARRPL